jgi:hypothetical protein
MQADLQVFFAEILHSCDKYHLLVGVILPTSVSLARFR